MHCNDDAPPVAVAPKSSGRSLQRWFDAVLLLTAATLLVCVSAYLVRTTHYETHRITGALLDSHVAHIARRTRTVGVANLVYDADAHTTPSQHTAAAVMPTPLSSSSLVVQSASSSNDAASRHLLATVDSSYAPFASKEEMERLYAEWEVDFKILSDRYANAGRAFVDFLAPAVDKLAVYAAPIGSTQYCIGGFDGREDPHFIFVLKHTFHMLTGGGYGGAIRGPKWSVVLWATPQNEPWLVRELQIGKGLPGEHIRIMRASPIGLRQASTMPASSRFWEAMPCEHTVYVQPDALMLRSTVLQSQVSGGMDLYEMMDRFAYLGGPWRWCTEAWCKNGGNGGASYRKRSAMLDFTRYIACTDWRCDWKEYYPEQEKNPDGWWHVDDTYFAHMIEKNIEKYRGRVATADEASWYSMETYGKDDVNPWFVHKIWGYIPHTRYIPIMARVKQFYPEIWHTRVH